jgi:N-acetyl-gamma-glutamyl-phosphate reductase
MISKSLHNKQIAMVTAAIIGCAGFAGQETLDRVLAHPGLKAVALGSNSQAGKPPWALDPRLEGRDLPSFVSNEEALGSGAELIFLCLGHDESVEVDPPADAVVVDLSGGHRLKDAALYEQWYGWKHPSPERLADWAYSVPELQPPTGRLVSNPGCYAVASIYALAPLAGIVDPASVVIDAKSGMTGAGKSLKASSHAGFVLENFSAYKVGSHQHAPEIAQLVGFPVCFVPHLLPIRRGLLATVYARTTATGIRERFEAAYEHAPAVRVLPAGVNPELSRVQHTDMAEIAVFEDRATGRTIVTCAIDNLGKGAAGNAVQNANLALGLEQTLGLRLEGVTV